MKVESEKQRTVEYRQENGIFLSIFVFNARARTHTHKHTQNKAGVSKVRPADRFRSVMASYRACGCIVKNCYNFLKINIRNISNFSSKVVTHFSTGTKEIHFR